MSNEKFTQGEWTAHIGIMEPTYIFIGKEDDYVDGETPVVCELYHGIKKKHPCTGIMDFDHTEIQANAALIAAAPKMYEKLEEIRDILYALSLRLRRCNEKKNAEQWMKEAIEIHKILKKAGGEE